MPSPSRRPRWPFVAAAAGVLVVLTAGVVWVVAAGRPPRATFVAGTSVVPVGVAGTPTTGPTATATTSPSASHRPATPAPSTRPPATSATLCGVAFTTEVSGETYQQAFAREDGYYGGVDIARIYYTGLPNNWPGKLNVGNRPLAVSFKAAPAEILAGTDDAYLRAWFRAAPTNRDTFWTYYHEPEDNIANGEFTAADYRAAWRHLVGLARSAGNPHLRSTLILMGWSVRAASHRNWRDYYPGRNVIDVLGWDQYNELASKGGYEAPADMFASLLAINRAEGLPLAVPETGSSLIGGDTGAARAAWLRSMITYLEAAHAVYVTYFDLPWPQGNADYRLRDAPSQSAWRAFCS